MLGFMPWIPAGNPQILNLPCLAFRFISFPILIGKAYYWGQYEIPSLSVSPWTANEFDEDSPESCKYSLVSSFVKLWRSRIQKCAVGKTVSSIQKWRCCWSRRSYFLEFMQKAEFINYLFCYSLMCSD